MFDMDTNKFVQDSLRTKSEGFEPKAVDKDIIHAAFGMVTEAGEALDVLKKAIFYGKEPDLINMDEEVGDILWYIAIYANARNKTIEQFAGAVIAKLRARYPDKFTDHEANQRDLLKEREILERTLAPVASGAHDANADVAGRQPHRNQ